MAFFMFFSSEFWNFSWFFQIFPSRIFPSRIFSKLKWLKDAGQRQAPCRLFTFASLRLCVIAPLIHIFSYPLNTCFVHFVNRSSESMEQWPIAPRGTMFILWTEAAKQWNNAAAPHDQYRRACAWGYETLRPAPLHRCALNRCAIRAPQTIGRAQLRVLTTLSSHCAALPTLPAHCSAPTLSRFGSVQASRGRGGAKCSKLELHQKTLTLSCL